MPVYLIHGFRWPRAGYTGIRVHAIVHNLEDCSVEYIQNEASKLSILQSFRDHFPEIMQHLEDKRTGRTLDFIEQYDPEDESTEHAVSQAHAFVADRVVTIAAGTSSSLVPKTKESGGNTDAMSPPSAGHNPGKPSTSSSATSSHLASPNTSALYLNVDETMSNGPVVTPQAWEALADLRDKIAEGEKIGWWVVYNGDPERSFSDVDDDQEESEVSDDEGIEEDEDPGTPTQTHSLLDGGVLGQPLPTLIPPAMKRPVGGEDTKENVESAQAPTPREVEKAMPDSTPTQILPKTEPVSPRRPKSNKSNFPSNFSLPLRRKSSKVNMPSPKGDDIPDPPALKEINKKEGRRYRFFGGKSDKKAS